MSDRSDAECGITTQASDKPMNVERRMIEAYRRMTPAEIFPRVAEPNETCEPIARAGIRLRHPQANENEVRLRLAALRLDPEIVTRVFGWEPRKERY